jgi:tRNA threonylcarbamoyladenosine biosynthesis protein TsaE
VTVAISRNEQETEAAGEALAARLNVGDIVLLSGTLGAGKTAFARGLARGLGCDLAGVSSPTFTIVQVYRGPVTMQHIDLYRLEPKEVDDLGLEDLAEEAVMAIEWPERWTRAPAGAIEVTIELIGDNERRIVISRPDA